MKNGGDQAATDGSTDKKHFKDRAANDGDEQGSGIGSIKRLHPYCFVVYNSIILRITFVAFSMLSRGMNSYLP